MEKIKFAVNNFTYSAKKLRNYIRDNHCIDGVVVRNHEKIRDSDFIVNWGTSIDGGLNKNAVMSKLGVFRELMRNNIPVPKFYSYRDTLELDEDTHEYVSLNGDRWILRDVNGYGGRDITGDILSLRDASEAVRYDDSKIIVEFIDKIAEFRVHFAGDETLIVRKIWHEDDSYETREEIAWNHDYGFVQKAMNNRYLKEILTNITLDVKKALEVDFGAVDIISDRYGRMYVLEYNSAPGLNEDNRLKLYADFISQEYESFMQSIGQ